MIVRAALLSLTLAGVACARSAPPPAVLDTAHEPCRYCRMVISDRRFASQIVAPYEEPQFFDDLGCLAHFLSAAPPLHDNAVIYVADHRSREWVRADHAVYVRVEARSAPMGSHILAHASVASRDADPDAAGGTAVEIRDVFPAGYVPGGF